MQMASSLMKGSERRLGERLSTFSVQVITLTSHRKIKPSRLWEGKWPQKLFLSSLTPSPRCERKKKKERPKHNHIPVNSGCVVVAQNIRSIESGSLHSQAFHPGNLCMYHPGNLCMYFQEEINGKLTLSVDRLWKVVRRTHRLQI